MRALADAKLEAGVPASGVCGGACCCMGGEQRTMRSLIHSLTGVYGVVAISYVHVSSHRCHGLAQR